MTPLISLRLLFSHPAWTRAEQLGTTVWWIEFIGTGTGWDRRTAARCQWTNTAGKYPLLCEPGRESLPSPQDHQLELLEFSSASSPHLSAELLPVSVQLLPPAFLSRDLLCKLLSALQPLLTELEGTELL